MDNKKLQAVATCLFLVHWNMKERRSGQPQSSFNYLFINVLPRKYLPSSNPLSGLFTKEFRICAIWHLILIEITFTE